MSGSDDYSTDRLAEAADYEALVVTVDNNALGWRERDVADGCLPFLDGKGVANHGGRQVNNAVPTFEALPKVASALPADVSVAFDPGARRSADALVALALEADAVELGQPYAYGLAVDGDDGAESVETS